MLGGILGGKGGGGLLGGLMEMLNPMKMLEKLTQLPQQLMGMLGGAGGGGPLEMLKGLDPTGLLGGLLGGAKERGL
jgi:hypothetical protein